MTKIKKYIIKGIKEFTDLHSSDIDENNYNISDKQYNHNYNEVKSAIDMVNYRVYKGSNCKIVCGIILCENGELSIYLYDSNRYKEISHFYLIF